MLPEFIKRRLRTSRTGSISSQSAPTSTPRSESETTRPSREPAQCAAPCWQTAHFPPRDHAKALLDWLEERHVVGEIRAPEMQRFYREMAFERNFAVRAWNPVAREIRRFLGGTKDYTWSKSNDGVRHRLRVYRVPPLLPPTPAAPKAAPAPGKVERDRTDQVEAA